MPLKMSLSKLLILLLLLSSTAIAVLISRHHTASSPVAKSEDDSPIGEDRTNSPVSPEEYEVYSVALANQREIDTKLVLVSSVTVSFGIDDPDIKPAGVQPRTVEDYRSKNQSTISLGDHFNLPVKHILVDAREIQSLLRKDTGEAWDDFVRRYPGAQSVCQLSRVGFNRNRDQALVFVHRFRPGGGTAQCVLLGKENGAWRATATAGPLLN
jgi:hypothetical protein